MTVVAETDLTAITGLRLEVLTDSRLSQQGTRPRHRWQLRAQRARAPGRAQGRPKQAKPVKLEKPMSDFDQDNLDIAKAIDGSSNDPSNGWAVSPATGVTHWATFETHEPIGAAGGSVLTFKLHHKFADQWTLGRFRLSVTRSAKPVGLSLPEDFRAILATAPEVRAESQKNVLIAYFRAVDAELRNKLAAVNASKAPLPARSQAQGATRSARVCPEAGPARPGAAWACGTIWR